MSQDVRIELLRRGFEAELERAATYVYEVRAGKAVYLAVYFDGEQARQIAREREAGADG